MKKKGFTLIELLAVIVILAIIAVITVPKIADMITSSRQGGAEDSFYGTLKAAELGYTKALQSNINLKGSTCTIENSKITCTNGVTMSVSGKTPESGTLVIETDGSTIAKGLTLNGYKCYGDLSTSNPCVKSDVEVASETLSKNIVTTGDGLYKDDYTTGRLIFRGSSPKNYITFNGESWQIIAIEPDGVLKIIREKSIGTMPWDAAGYRSPATSTYCKNAEQYGCSVWNARNEKYNGGTVTQNASLNDYLNGEYYKGLSDKSKTYITNYAFNVGVLEYRYANNVDQSPTIKENQNEEMTAKWKGKIGLINITDYLKASLDSACVSDYSSRLEGYPCANNNYLFNPEYWWWSINGGSNSTSSRHITNGGTTSGTTDSNAGDVRPVLYLKANLQITGAGTSSDPYKIK